MRPLIQMISFILAQAPAAPSAASSIGNFVPFIFIFVIMYFVLLRPQMKRQKDQQRLVSALKTGDRVVTNGGIHGLISNVKDTTVIVKVADNVKIEIEKTAVTTVLKSAEPSS
jgi:preprotein translocase subunit YajC